MLARGIAALSLFLVLLLVPACDEFAEDKEEIKTVFANVNLYNKRRTARRSSSASPRRASRPTSP
jgi:hypothetical protein